jgi:CelD/BcsL family acetyltransferase involved in cellulose biosynthesis
MKAPLEAPNHSSSWNWTVETSLERLLELKPVWKRLHEQSSFPTVFGLHEFHCAWFLQHQEDWELRTVIGKDETDTVRFIGPFVTRKTSKQQWRFGLPEHCDYDALLYRADDPRAVAEFRDWMVGYEESISISLQSLVLDPGASQAVSLVDRGKNRLINACRLLLSARPIFYRITNSNHPYLSDANVSVFRHALEDKRHVKNISWFEKKQPIRFDIYSTAETVNALLPRFFEFHLAQWGASAPEVFTRDSRNLNFFRQLCSMEVDDFPVRLHVLSWGDVWLAAHLGFEWRSRLYWYLPSHNAQFASRAPGKLLLAYLLRACARKGGVEFDFLRGNEPYKLEATNTIRKSDRLDIFSTRWALIHFLGGKINYGR